VRAAEAPAESTPAQYFAAPKPKLSPPATIDRHSEVRAAEPPAESTTTQYFAAPKPKLSPPATVDQHSEVRAAEASGESATTQYYTAPKPKLSPPATSDPHSQVRSADAAPAEQVTGYYAAPKPKLAPPASIDRHSEVRSSPAAAPAPEASYFRSPALAQPVVITKPAEETEAQAGTSAAVPEKPRLAPPTTVEQPNPQSPQGLSNGSLQMAMLAASTFDSLSKEAAPQTEGKRKSRLTTGTVEETDSESDDEDVTNWARKSLRRSQIVPLRAPAPARKTRRKRAANASSNRRRQEAVHISGHLGRRPVNGEYKSLGRRYMEAPVYFCKQANAYLFRSARNVSWGIGDRPSGGLIALVQDDAKTATDIRGPWKVYGGTEIGWLEDPSIVLTPKSEDDIMDAVVVECRDSSLAGGYRKSKEEINGSPVYTNEDDRMIWFNGQQWVISSNLMSPHCAVLATSEDASGETPEEATWEGLAVTSAEASESDYYSEDEDEEEEDICFGNFVDEDFLPDDSSLGGDRKQLESREWVRGTQLCVADPPLLHRSSPGCLMRGAEGDCWLLAAIAAIAEFPGYLEKTIFNDGGISSTGRFSLNLYDASLRGWTEVVVDDLIPCRPRRWFEKRSKPYYSQPAENDLHVLLIEKALAKFAGTYSALMSGRDAENLAWLALTGEEQQVYWDRGYGGIWFEKQLDVERQRQVPRSFWPAALEETGKKKNSEDLFTFLSKCVACNYLLGASIGMEDGPTRRKDGLVEGFMYSVLCIGKVGDVRLVQLRNPWDSTQQWNGKWSLDSPLWQEHSDVRAAWRPALEPGSGADCDEGAFYMSFEDFAKLFDRIHVSHKDMGVPRASEGQRGAIATRWGLMVPLTERRS